MVTSIHLLTSDRVPSLRKLRRLAKASAGAGLDHAQPMLLAELSPHVYRPPQFHGHAWIATWRDTDALERFLAGDHAASVCRDWWARLSPIRVVGRWAAYSDLPDREIPAGDGAVAALTLGRLKPNRIRAFLRTSARAEADALAAPGLEFAAALAGPPRIVATFSIWHDHESMRAYVERDGHHQAIRSQAARPFHAESAFIRYRILDQHGRLPAALARPGLATPAPPVRAAGKREHVGA